MKAWQSGNLGAQGEQRSRLTRDRGTRQEQGQSGGNRLKQRKVGQMPKTSLLRSLKPVPFISILRTKGKGQCKRRELKKLPVIIHSCTQMLTVRHSVQLCIKMSEICCSLNMDFGMESRFQVTADKFSYLARLCSLRFHDCLGLEL